MEDSADRHRLRVIDEKEESVEDFEEKSLVERGESEIGEDMMLKKWRSEDQCSKPSEEKLW